MPAESPIPPDFENEFEVKQHNLRLLNDELEKLYNSMYGQKPGETIQFLNKAILDEQSKESPDEKKLDEYKAKLIAEYRNYDQNLRYLVRNHLPEALFKKLSTYKIDLVKFPEGMFDSIIQLMTQDLSKK